MRATRWSLCLSLLILLAAGSAVTGLATPSDSAERTAPDILLAAYSSTNYEYLCDNLAADLTATGANVQYHLITTPTDGWIAAALGSGSFDQVWVLDLYSQSEDRYSDATAIWLWWEGNGRPHVIVDARIASDLNSGTGGPLVKNYVANADARGGALVLLTDHNAFANQGMNDLLSVLGFGPVYGSTTVPCGFDSASPLMIFPNAISQVPNTFTGGSVPFNFQPNGTLLYPVAWYEPNGNQMSISSTIVGAVGLMVTILEPADGAYVDQAQPVQFSAEAEQGNPPIWFEWTSDVDGTLGSGNELLVMLSHGTHQITCRATDSQGFVAIDEITIHPIEDDPTPTERSSWGSVKALFRD